MPTGSRSVQGKRVVLLFLAIGMAFILASFVLMARGTNLPWTLPVGLVLAAIGNILGAVQRERGSREQRRP